MECKIMSTIAQFKMLAEACENGRPPCSDVRRLLEVADGEREELETFLMDVSRDLMMDRPERDFRTVYSDGNCELWRGPQGQYVKSEIQWVSSYTDFDRSM
jgi:hypothetical protein